MLIFTNPGPAPRRGWGGNSVPKLLTETNGIKKDGREKSPLGLTETKTDVGAQAGMEGGGE